MKRIVELGDQKKQLHQRFGLNEIHFSVNFIHFLCGLCYLWVVLDL
jgi:hypothetical protein